jgi:uncharacterized protein (DUF488 family)
MYTIGHGNRQKEVFLKLLQQYHIEYLIDVRSIPYSRFHPQFRQNALKNFLAEHDITYVFMGDLLGGRPSDKTCYDAEGRIDYSILSTKSFYLEGITRLRTALQKNLSAALMCSESKPFECHRSKLIGTTFMKENIILQHIDENGKLIPQPLVLKF